MMQFRTCPAAGKDLQLKRQARADICMVNIEQKQSGDNPTELGKKIRLIVEVATNAEFSLRYVIPFDRESTIEDLALEVSKRVTLQQQTQFLLTLADSSILCAEDRVGDVVEPGEIIYAHAQGPPSERQTLGQTVGISSPGSPLVSCNSEITLCGDTQATGKRVTVALITPELARNGGKGESLKIIAFNGSRISVSLCMDMLRREIARSLGWIDEEFGIIQDRADNHERDRIIPRGSCSCTVSNQLFLAPRLEQLHCPTEIGNVQCANKECIYSHAPLFPGTHPYYYARGEECKICNEPYKSPCEKCSNLMANVISRHPEADSPESPESSTTICPLVQNAQCGHIFHAHCYFGMVPSMVSRGCPAGCPGESISAEAIPFEFPDPHILVVHSGCVVEKICVPIENCPQARGGAVVLKDRQLIDILRKNYEHFGQGLTVTMHGRKNTGLVVFRHSTVVSICCSSRHSEPDGIVRFELNGPLPSPKHARVVMDLHTAASPIFNESSTATIASLGLDVGVEDGGEVALYVVKRNNTQRSTQDELRSGKTAVFMNREDWQPSVSQSEKGMAAFLSCLLVFTHYLSLGHKENQESTHMLTRILVHLLGLTNFPPAIRTLFILSRNESITPEETRALAETLYYLCVDVSHPLITKGDLSKTFEGARLLFGIIVERSKGTFTLSRVENWLSAAEGLFQETSLVCGLSGEPLRDPVQHNGQIVERGMTLLKKPGGPLFDGKNKDKEISTAPATLFGLLKRTAGKMKQLVVFDASVDIPPVLVRKLTPSSLELAIAMANREFPIHAPLSLKKAVTPALTLDKQGKQAVYISKGDPCGPADTDAIIFRPCDGGELGVDTHVLAMILDLIIQKRKATNDWNIDAFAGAQSDRVDAREIEEAVVLCLDVSSSMNDHFTSGTDAEHDDTEAEDPDERALEFVNDSFAKRELASDTFVLAKIFLNDLECLPSVAQFIVSNSVPDERGMTMPIDRAKLALQELSLLFRRLRWQDAQRDMNKTVHAKWECFIIAAASPSIPLAQYLLDKCAHLEDHNTKALGSNGIPKRLCDPLTGKLFVDPVKGDDNQTYEMSSITAWFDTYKFWPSNPVTKDSTSWRRPSFVRDAEMKRDVGNFLATRCGANVPATLSQGRMLVKLTRWGQKDCVYIPSQDNPSLTSILFDYWRFSGKPPSTCRLWQNYRNTGDGRFRGNVLNPVSRLSGVSSKRESVGPLEFTTVKLEIREWRHTIPEGPERVRKESRMLSRLDIVKQAFEAFINKSEAFNYPVAIGLITFGADVRIVQPFTLLKEQFRNSMRTVTATGDTPLFDSLALAQSMLQSFKKDHTQAKLRVICLTDGYDIGSNARPETVTARLQSLGVVVDSIAVHANTYANNAHGISVATGGYSFAVNTLETALNVAELETVLQSKDRLERKAKPIVRSAMQLKIYQNRAKYPMDIVTSEECPGRKPHVRLSEPQVPAQKAVTNFVPSTNRERRLMQEIRQVVNAPHPAIDVYCGDDLSFWKIVIEAPEDTPYVGGTFLAYVDFGPEYPQVAPEVRFITPILHPNINRHGKICHAVLDRGWLVDMSMITILQILYSLLLTPDNDNPLDLHAAMEYNDDTGEHALKVHEMVKKFASKSRATWRKEMGG